ncbi:hypothetical protein AGMMS49992_16280 [Clostridia bacterium]|nr:hypothetical protein AGMMS49992_16280 [Clostridia bacterium]
MCSVLAQRHVGFEVILSDDGVTEMGPCIDDFSLIDQRVAIVHNINRGVSAARNTGIDLASGDFLLFSDADDTVVPEWVITMLNTQQSSGADFVYCGHYSVGKDVIRAVPLPYVGLFANKEDILTRVIMPMLFFQYEHDDVHYKNILSTTWLGLYSKRIISKHTIRFMETLRYAEDCQFNVEYISHCCSACFDNHLLYWYHHYDYSAANHFQDNQWDALVLTCEAKKQFLIANKIPESSWQHENALQIMSYAIMAATSFVFDNHRNLSRKWRLVHSIVRDPYLAEALRKIDVNRLCQKEKLQYWMFQKRLTILLVGYKCLHLTLQR